MKYDVRIRTEILYTTHPPVRARTHAHTHNYSYISNQWKGETQWASEHSVVMKCSQGSRCMA